MEGKPLDMSYWHREKAVWIGTDIHGGCWLLPIKESEEKEWSD